MSENANGNVKEAMPNTEVVAKAKRKRFTAAEKLRILREVDACQGSGEIGALLRREGIYSSYLTTWRRQRERGELDGLAPQRRGRNPIWRQSNWPSYAVRTRACRNVCSGRNSLLISKKKWRKCLEERWRRRIWTIRVDRLDRAAGRERGRSRCLPGTGDAP